MATMAELHRKGFEERLARIQQGGPNCIGHVHVGPREEVRARDAEKAKKAIVAKARKAQRRGSPVATVLLLPIALGIGAVSMFAGRVASYQFFTDGAPYAFSLGGVGSAMFADVAVAAVLAIVLAWAFHLTFGMRRLAVLAGFVLMMTAEGQVVERFPDIYETFFSETYVTAVLADVRTRL